MSPLTVLYLVLPLPLAFIIREAEVFAFQRRRKREANPAAFPRCRKLLEFFGCAESSGTKMLTLAELAIVLAVTALVLVQMPHANVLWTVVFLVFSLRLILNIVRSLAARSYVPGLVTSVILLPYAALGCHSVYISNSIVALVLYGLSAFILTLPYLRLRK